MGDEKSVVLCMHEARNHKGLRQRTFHVLTLGSAGHRASVEQSTQEHRNKRRRGEVKGRHAATGKLRHGFVKVQGGTLTHQAGDLCCRDMGNAAAGGLLCHVQRLEWGAG